jgi:hypothetical protein
MEVVNDYPIVENQKQSIVQSIQNKMTLTAGGSIQNIIDRHHYPGTASHRDRKRSMNNLPS